MKPCVLILAAGQSSRMGAVKALLPLPLLPGGRQCPALEGLVRLYREAGVEDILLVSGYHAPVVEEAAAKLKISVVRNAVPHKGMFSSVCAGLRELKGRPDRVGGVFVHPVDVPLTRSMTVMSLLEQAGEDAESVLIPAFNGVEGHPPFIPGMYLEHLLVHAAQGGGNGLRGALEGLPLRHVPVADSFMLLDMDRREDYWRLKRLARERSALSPFEALTLLRVAAVPERGLRHAKAVGVVAYELAHALASVGRALSPELALSGGLLHDLCKGQTRHEAAGGRFLRKLGLPRMAALVEDHRDISLPGDEALGERELVYLADKYCFGQEFVPVERRFTRKMEIYADNPEACEGIRGRMGRARDMEERLARELGRPPGDIARQALTRLHEGGGPAFDCGGPTV